MYSTRPIGTDRIARASRWCEVLSFGLLILLFVGCRSSSDPAIEKGERIISDVRATHGSARVYTSTIEFDFRGDHYVVREEQSDYRYVRRFETPNGTRVREVLTPDSTYRMVNGRPIRLQAQQQAALRTEINSVVYFALLPEPLADPAVQPRYLREGRIDGEPYHLIEVTFRKKGGGRDYEDRFIYWIHREESTMDYLAYYYHTDGGGSRFRAALNPRTVSGIRFQDYLNYTATSDTIGYHNIEEYGAVMKDNGLEKVSEIRLKNVRVRSGE